MAFIYAGNDLRSHTLSRAVPSARRGLTSVFGMGTGGTPAVRSPTNRSRQSFGRQLLPADGRFPDQRQTCQRSRGRCLTTE